MRLVPQVNGWKRCACPGAGRHNLKACGTEAGFETLYDFICMPCLTGCNLYIIPAQPYSDSFGRTGQLPGVVVAMQQMGRAGDADRDEGFAKLEDAFVFGRIPQEEYERRLNLIGDASWKAEIQAYLADLPAPER